MDALLLDSACLCPGAIGRYHGHVLHLYRHAPHADDAYEPRYARTADAVFGRYSPLCEVLPQVQFLTVEPGSDFVPFRMIGLCPQREALMAYLSQQGIQARTFFYPLHQQPCFAHLDKNKGGRLDLRDKHYPNAIFGYEHGMSLPIFPALTQEEVGYICATIKVFYAHSA